MSKIEAVFPNEDDALSASTHLRTMDGIRDIQTERRTNDDNDNIYWMGLLGMNTRDNMALNSTSGSGVFPGQIGAFEFADDSFGNGTAAAGGGYDVLLSCSVEEGQKEAVVAAIKEAGGRVME